MANNDPRRPRYDYRERDYEPPSRNSWNMHDPYSPESSRSRREMSSYGDSGYSGYSRQSSRGYSSDRYSQRDARSYSADRYSPRDSRGYSGERYSRRDSYGYDGYSRDRGTGGGYTRQPAYAGGYQSQPASTLQTVIDTVLTVIGFLIANIKIVGAVVAAIIVGIIIFMSLPVTVQVNGQEASVSRGTTYQGLADQGLIDVKSGNLLDVQGGVLQEGGGNPPTFFVDGNEVSGSAIVSTSGNITAEPGTDATESYQATSDIEPVQTKIARDKKAEAEGASTDFNFYNGILHVVTQEGAEGIVETRTGDISGLTATVETQKMEPRVVENIHNDLPESQKLIALTFDDGPGPNDDETPAVLAVLDKHDVKGTFFMLGSEAQEYPSMAKKVADAGHQICSHSYSHDAEHFLNATTPDDVRFQISEARKAIGEATGIEPTLVRPPGGNVDVEAIEAAGTLADGYIGWSVDPHDYERPGADAIADYIYNYSTPGAVVLLHDGGGERSQTAEALDKVIPKLKKKGYTFVTIDELIAACRANG